MASVTLWRYARVATDGRIQQTIQAAMSETDPDQAEFVALLEQDDCVAIAIPEGMPMPDAATQRWNGTEFESLYLVTPYAEGGEHAGE